jgi:hypothetical protein
MNKDNLINIGATLHGKEWPIYILWLLDRIEEQAAPFLSEKDSCTKVHSLSLSLSLSLCNECLLISRNKSRIYF